MHTVVIPCAGTGSRLGELTRFYNKAMLTLGPKPIISYIIEHFTKDDEIIILLGYKGDFLRQVIQALYPGWNIIFREVDVFEGPGSGLGYSLSRAEDLLQKPFIFWPNDTLISNNVNELPDCNWVMTGMREQESKDYRHVLIDFGKGCTILPKQAVGYYNTYPYTGVCCIHDYEKFWEAYHNNPQQFVEEGEVVGINNLPEVADVPANNWIDTGNKKIFESVRERYNEQMEEVILEKPDEAIWFVDDRVIKFHVDPKFISDRVKRFDTFLSDKQKTNGIKIPELLYYSKNVYVYKREPGVIASKRIDVTSFRQLLKNFFSYQKICDTDSDFNLKVYEDFYHKKTVSRINKFCKSRNREDVTCTINGLPCMSALKAVEKINWKKIAESAIFTPNYHGDFHLENILIQNNKFVMLDWRQNFGASEIGDVYYDYAKMWHSLIVNHSIVRDELFETLFNKNNPNIINIDIYRPFVDTELEEILKSFIVENGADIKQAELITALVFLNIAACHVGEYSDFLFYLGKYLINKVILKYPELFIGDNYGKTNNENLCLDSEEA